jgi:hypothetical protein
MRTDNPPSDAAARARRPAGPATLWGAWIAALLALLAVAASIGGPQGPGLAAAVVVETLLRSAWPAALLLLGAVGLGRWLTRVPGLATIRSGAPAAGLGAMLVVFMILGPLGWLGFWTVAAVCALGLAGLVLRPRWRGARRGPAGWLWAGLPGLALLLAASASPPGALWSSEYGAYDALSYHLQLPREWLRSGNTRPLEHNVYSFLPGAFEGAFAAMAHLTRPPGDDLLAGEGWRLMGAHGLHAGVAVLGAGLIARLALRLASAAGLDRKARRIASTVGGGLVLCTPWTIVVGSIAYNDMGVVALGAGSMLAACRRDRAPGVQAALVGAMVGIACLVKPTALFMVGIPAGVLLLRFLPIRAWGRAVLIGSIAGVLALSPWLVRNAAACGSPVFPFATGVFGAGHWTEEQGARWARAHAPQGSAPDRLRLAIWTDPSTEPGDNPVARRRGVSNPQWLALFPSACAAGAVLLFGVRRRRIALGLLLALGGQLGAWLLLTHLQSRFLIPCLLTAAPLVGIAAGAVRTPRFAGAGSGLLLCLVQVVAAWTIFTHERGGAPNALLLAGPGAFMGAGYTRELGEALPAAFVNHELPEGAAVVLVGGATPLYYRHPVRYATVWDRSTLFDLPERLATHDAEELFVLIDFGELARLRASGYLDPGITPGLLDRVLRRLEAVREWPAAGVRLYRRAGNGERER